MSSSRTEALRSRCLHVLIVAAAAILVAALLLPPIAQPPDYHRFADARTLLGIPNFWNVVSNLPILAAGIAGLWLVGSKPAREALAVPAARRAYVTLFSGLALTAFGSAYYHWAPDSARLVWDRLPMTIGFTSLLAAVIIERVSARAGLRLLAPMVLLGLASVLWWRWTMIRGAEDVGPYAAVQFGSIALVLLCALLYPAAGGNGGGIFVLGLYYAAAKGVEMLDDRIFALGGLLSGHTLKHLLVAAAGFQIISMARRR